MVGFVLSFTSSVKNNVKTHEIFSVRYVARPSNSALHFRCGFVDDVMFSYRGTCS